MQYFLSCWYNSLMLRTIAFMISIYSAYLIGLTFIYLFLLFSLVIYTTMGIKQENVSFTRADRYGGRGQEGSGPPEIFLYQNWAFFRM